MTNELNYTNAFHELQEIVSEIESGDINVDELSAKVQRASELINVCRAKLNSTEKDVSSILKEMNDADEN